MGPYGSVWADIKTGRSPMAHDHFQTPPDPKRGFPNPKKGPTTRPMANGRITTKIPYTNKKPVPICFRY